MKNLITFLFSSSLCFAQVGINTSTPDASAALDVESTTGGILIPRMTQVQRDAIASPSNGLMIYQTNAVQGFYYFNGNQWVSIANSSTGTEGFFSSTSITADTYNENISISADLTNVDNWEVLYPDISGPSVSSFPNLIEHTYENLSGTTFLIDFVNSKNTTSFVYDTLEGECFYLKATIKFYDESDNLIDVSYKQTWQTLISANTPGQIYENYNNNDTIEVYGNTFAFNSNNAGRKIKNEFRINTGIVTKKIIIRFETAGGYVQDRSIVAYPCVLANYLNLDDNGTPTFTTGLNYSIMSFN